MKNDDNKDAFLRSVLGANPINKTNKIKKEMPKEKKIILKKNSINVGKTIVEIKEDLTKHNTSVFTLEKSSINKKLKKGKIPIDKKIDFHGLSVLEAKDLFSTTIINCYNIDFRCILFVTGKGVQKKIFNNEDNTRLYYGKIRESFFVWTKEQNMQKYILAVEQANIEHGADGAFFVYLRKKTNFF